MQSSADEGLSLAVGLARTDFSHQDPCFDSLLLGWVELCPSLFGQIKLDYLLVYGEFADLHL